MEGNVKKVLSGVGFYGTLAVCLTIVGVCGWLLLSDRQEPAVETPVTPQVPVSQPVKMPERAVETPVEIGGDDAALPQTVVGVENKGCACQRLVVRGDKLRVERNLGHGIYSLLRVWNEVSAVVLQRKPYAGKGV